MKNIRFVLSENFMFLEVKFSIHLKRHVFVMSSADHDHMLQNLCLHYHSSSRFLYS